MVVVGWGGGGAVQAAGGVRCRWVGGEGRVTRGRGAADLKLERLNSRPTVPEYSHYDVWLMEVTSVLDSGETHSVSQ